LGICLGLQIAVIEFARNVLGLADANSTEFNPETKNDVVIFMPEGSKEIMGATMRLGIHPCYLLHFVYFVDIVPLSISYYHIRPTAYHLCGY